MSDDFTMPHGLTAAGPLTNDYFGLWAMCGATLHSMTNRFRGFNLSMHLHSIDLPKLAAERQASVSRVTPDGVVVFRISGPMMKSVSCLTNGTSTVQLRQAISHARREPSVVGGLLVMDTPGGTVAGNADLAAEVAAFAKVKPIFAYVEDLTASGGVSVASQATKRFANAETAIYGSIGTFQVLVDESGAAERLGVKVHVIKAGEYKGMGAAGTKVTDPHLAEAQRVVNAQNESYLQLIAKGLGKPVESIRALADGRAIMAKDAVALGLLDGIQSFDATYSQLVAAVGKRKAEATTPKPSAQVSQPAAMQSIKPAPTVVKRDPVAEFSQAVSKIAGPNPTYQQRTAAIQKVARDRPKLHAEYLRAVGRRSEMSPTY